MEDSGILDIPSDHVFARTDATEGSVAGYCASGLLEVLPMLKRTQLAEILAVSGFTGASDLSEVVISPNVITRVWLFQAISEYIAQGDKHGDI